MAEERISPYPDDFDPAVPNGEIGHFTSRSLGTKFTVIRPIGVPASAPVPGPSHRLQQTPTSSPRGGGGGGNRSDPPPSRSRGLGLGLGSEGREHARRRLTPYYSPNGQPVAPTATTVRVQAVAPGGSEPGRPAGTFIQSQTNPSGHHDLLILIVIFLVSFLALYLVYSTFPKLEEKEKKYITLPRNIHDAKGLANVLNRYKEKYYVNVLCAVFLLYIFLQTFAIPGSIFLSILSGFLFSFWLALLLVCFCSATGATCCYGLSWMLGRRLIYKYFPERVESWAAAVNNNRDVIFNYIFFLRVTPFVPNFFINIASPILAVPVLPFYFGTFFGVAPPSFVMIHAGTTLHTLTSSSDAITWTTFFLLIFCGLLALVPVVFKEKWKRKFE